MDSMRVTTATNTSARLGLLSNMLLLVGSNNSFCADNTANWGRTGPDGQQQRLAAQVVLMSLTA